MGDHIERHTMLMSHVVHAIKHMDFFAFLQEGTKKTDHTEK